MLSKSTGGRRGAPPREDIPPPLRADRAQPGPPPSIADLKAFGMTHLTLICATITCRRELRLLFDELAMPDETLFPAIGSRCKFVCVACGGRRVEAFPDWSTVRAPGKPPSRR